jgi:hypothetical protein
MHYDIMMVFSARGVIMLQGVPLFKLAPFMRWHNTKVTNGLYFTVLSNHKTTMRCLTGCFFAPVN